ncbi:hypothetical protein [Wolbachia endosymbiont of Zaprionus tsacasi]|nr:hypothetical protein [Wolbachia endosymbiont of Zaprionus tsacasi]MCE4149210.1 hypothetical protein [Wolbachia endosymbiont of Drosophila melanogaster]MDE5060346.1 hypothetical protein [Wolbachia endosymbiont of Drosophila burlai]WOE64123.1 hypothetical protein R0F63_00940 [Wolbachia endosymbiont of Zaprionus tsacasi]
MCRRSISRKDIIVKVVRSQCLGTGMTPSWMETSVSYLDDASPCHSSA